MTNIFNFEEPCPYCGRLDLDCICLDYPVPEEWEEDEDGDDLEELC